MRAPQLFNTQLFLAQAKKLKSCFCLRNHLNAVNVPLKIKINHNIIYANKFQCVKTKHTDILVTDEDNNCFCLMVFFKTAG